MNYFWRALACALVSICGFGSLQAAPGDWDRAFGTNGRVALTIPGITFSARTWQQQADGKWVVAGLVTDSYTNETREYIVARFNSNGTPDTSFDSDGYVRLNLGTPYIGTVDLALQSDGKILFAGEDNGTNARIIRLLPNGTRDASFGTGGELALLASNVRNVRMRLTADGSIITACATGTTTGTATISRITSAGAPDLSFGNNGQIELSYEQSALIPYALLVMPDGSAVIGGNISDGTTAVPFVARVTRTGTKDLTFGNRAFVLLPFLDGDGYINVLASQDDKLLVAGQRKDSTGYSIQFIGRINSSGTFDGSFGSSGRIVVEAGEISSLVAQSDGKITASGLTYGPDNQTWIARYNSDGSPDLAFGLRGVSHSDFATDDKLVVSTLFDLKPGVDGSYTGIVKIVEGAFLSTTSFALARFVAQGNNPGVIGIRSGYESPRISLNEASGDVQLTVYRSGGAEGQVSVQYRTVDGTATGGQDFVAQTGTVTFNDGELYKTIAVHISDDSLRETTDETFYVDLFSPTNGAGLSKSRATFTISSDDDYGERVDLVETSTEVLESAGVAHVVVQRTGDLTGALTVTCTLRGGTAAATSDFDASTRTLQWPANQGGALVLDIPIVDDAVAEGNEDFTVALSAPSGVSIQQATETVTIADDDTSSATSYAGFVTSTLVVSENAGSATLVVDRIGDASQPLSASWTIGTAIGSFGATAGQDFVNVSGTVSWAAGDGAPKNIVIPLVNDSVFEALEYLSVSLYVPYPAFPFSNVASVYIVDDDGIPTQPVASIGSDTSVAETAGNVIVPVTLTGLPQNDVTVRYAIAYGSASVQDVPYTYGTLSWSIGQTATKNIVIPVSDDATDEPNETFTIHLSDPSGGVSIGRADATITIVDNDPTPSGQPAPAAPDVQPLNTSVTVNESQRSVTLKFQRTGDPSSDLWCYLAAVGGAASEPSDYVVPLSTLYWNAGETGTKEIQIQINGDAIAEPTESVTLRLFPFGSASPASPDINLTLLDDDGPTASARVGFITPTQSVDENKSEVTLQVGRTGNVQQASSVNFKTVAGTATSSDFVVSSGTLTWDANDTSVKSVTIALSQDTTDEPDENFTVVLSDASSGTDIDSATATVTIVDDDVGTGATDPAPPTPTTPVPVTSTSNSGSSKGKGGGGPESLLLIGAYAALILWRTIALRRRERCT